MRIHVLFTKVTAMITPSANAQDSKFSYFHQAVRWFYRIVFGFLLFGIAESLVQSFVQEWFASGRLTFPTLKHLYILQLLLHYPLMVGPPTTLFMVLGFLGLAIDLRFIKIKETLEKDHMEGVALVAGTTGVNRATATCRWTASSPIRRTETTQRRTARSRTTC